MLGVFFFKVHQTSLCAADVFYPLPNGFVKLNLK
jgi:hypothetical protein